MQVASVESGGRTSEAVVIENPGAVSVSFERTPRFHQVSPCVALLTARVYVSPMRVCFKEWAVVVDALGRGRQIIILRKGGISEGRGGFHIEHRQFLLFPTLFHQQRESVSPEAQARYDEIAPTLPSKEILRLEYWGEIVDSRQLDTLEMAEALRGQHIWRDDVIAERFDWGRDKTIFAFAVRIHQLPISLELPMLPAYGGCKSWIELDREIDTANSHPVLSDSEFSERLQSFRAALQPLPAVT